MCYKTNKWLYHLLSRKYVSDGLVWRDYLMADANLSMFASNLIATVNVDNPDYEMIGI